MPGESELDPTEGMEAFLGYKVREARKAKGWTQGALAGKAFSSTTRISDVERGIDPPDRGLAVALGELLGLGDELVILLRMMENREVRDYARPFLNRQSQATQMHEFSTTVPGLLQTTDYALAAMRAGQAGDSTDIGRFAERRIDQQRVWERRDPPWLWLVLDESVLHREMGPPNVMCEQLKHMVVMSERPNINIQILPFGTAHVSGYLSLLTMPGGGRGAYTEGFSTGRYTEDPEGVGRFQRVYDRLHSDALSAGVSGQLISKAIERFS
ncbi:helix-turn-helix transcriptional regulator [Streptomyces sp. NPDC050610]|uniref:helix-turn-helix domain-containing protein n=1 Tax=Streptomyces sp. NPDC050610 TaxID=3157097 RepID=UPI00342F52EC